MSGHSLPGRSGSVADSPGRSHGQQLALRLSRGAFLGAATTAVLILVVLYRLWALATAQQPEGFPAGWIFSFGSLLTAPFRDTGASSVKETGYLDFPAIVALDVLLVATFVLTILGYMLSLFVPQADVAPKPVAAKVKQPPKPHIVPAIKASVRLLARAVATVVLGAVAIAKRPDWPGYAAMLWLAVSGLMLWIGGGLRRAARWYWAGVELDWAGLSAFWQARYADTSPRAGLLATALRQDGAADFRALKYGTVIVARLTRETAVRVAASAKAQTAITWREVLGLSRQTWDALFDCIVGIPAVVRGLSRCYWRSIGVLSRSLLMLPLAFRSWHAASRAPDDAEFAEALQPVDRHISRREFFRRLMPLR